MTKGGIPWKKVGKVSGKIAKGAVTGAVGAKGDIPWKKVGRVSGRIAKGALTTGIGAYKIAKSVESGDPYGAYQGVNTVAAGLLGKRNPLQKAEDKLDNRLSKSKAYRLGKNSFLAYHNAAGGNFTGAYNDSMKVAKDIIGEKRYNKTLGKLDDRIQQYVMPSAQLIQNSYGLSQALQKPIDTKKGIGQNALQVYGTANKIKNTYKSAKVVNEQINKKGTI